MRCISCALVWRGLEEGGGWQNGQMIGEDIPFDDGEGMHIARIEGPAAGYVLYLLGPGMEGTGEGEENGKKVR